MHGTLGRAGWGIVGAAVLVGLLTAVAVAAGSPPEDITVGSVAGPTESVVSIVVPFLGVVLVLRSARPATLCTLGRAVGIALTWAAALAILGMAITVVVVAIVNGGGHWTSLGRLLLGSVLVQLVAQATGTGLGMLTRRPLLACLLTVLLPLGLWSSLGAVVVLQPARVWLTPFASVQRLLAVDMDGLAWVQWLVMVSIWGLGLNLVGAWLMLRPRAARHLVPRTSTADGAEPAAGAAATQRHQPTAHSLAVDLPQGRVRYHETGPLKSEDHDGSAPVVVFVHGLLVNASLWAPTADLLASAGVRSIAPDLPLGAHPMPLGPAADLSPRGIAVLLLDLLEQLDLTNVTLVGNDTGGALCQFVLDTDNTRIGRLVLTNCDAFDRFPPPPFGLLVRLARHPTLIRAVFRPMRIRALRHSRIGFGSLVADHRSLDPRMTASWIQPVLDSKAVRHDLAKLAQAIEPADLLDISTRLHRFDRPVSLVWGSADPYFTLSSARRLRDTFPSATLTEIEGARTLIPLDEPHRLADAIIKICLHHRRR